MSDTQKQKIFELTPFYVVNIPEEISEGKIYISNEYKTVIHLCACGCGEKTVTPLGYGEWNLSGTKEKVTLRPSIGNFMWEHPYHAHYYITDGKVIWL